MLPSKPTGGQSVSVALSSHFLICCVLKKLSLNPDSNPRDYRAWYGLGQGYELLKMPFYTLYYYQKATSLRPYDTRIWGALGKSYEELDRLADAIKCFERQAQLFLPPPSSFPCDFNPWIS